MPANFPNANSRRQNPIPASLQYVVRCIGVSDAIDMPA
jgi:hypothetical protein